jgi:hypothetical protein
MRKILHTLVFSALLQGVAAQPDYSIYLQSGTLPTSEGLPADSLPNHTLAASQFGAHYYLVLQFTDLPTPARLNELTDLGVGLYGYLPNYAYIARVPLQVEWHKIQARRILPLQARHKLSKALADSNYSPQAIPDTNITVQMYPFPEISLMTLLESLQQKGFDAKVRGAGVLVTIATSRLLDLAQHPAVLYVEAQEAAPKAEGWVGRAAQRVNLVSAGAGLGLDGSGVALAIGDDGSVAHEDFRGRLTDFNTSDDGNHGDMTAGLAIGSGNLNPLGMGMAPGAHLYLYPIDNYPHLENAVMNLQQRNVVLTSTSYGEGCSGVYTSGAQQMDAQLYHHNALLHFFSAGNSGEEICGIYSSIVAPDGGRFGTITGGRKVAKNTIAVGNTTYDDQLLTSSSRGPTADGRLKPDLCAHGQGNLSTDAANGYRSGGGTSAAAPSLAGTTALLYQAYRERNSGANPNSALIKAALLNTADDLGNPGPDYRTGFGRVHASRALEVLQNNWYTSSTVTNGATQTHAIQIPAGTQQLRVLLYWHDPEALPNAAKALVNDLDLILKTPTGDTYLPWVLSTTAHSDSLNSPAYRGVDRLNNVEQITLETPPTGNYTITIRGNFVPKGPQPYVLVYFFVKEELRLTYPNGGEGFVPEETETIRWDAVGNVGTFSLEYSTNEGADWQTIATNIARHLRHFDWKIPKITATKALIRVSRNGKRAVSAQAFSILELPDFQVVHVSPNAAALRWRKVPGATSYEVYALGGKYMEVTGATADTSFQLPMSAGHTGWYSVRARHTNGAAGRRAIAQHYTHRSCEAKVTLKLQFDLYPGETFWDVKDATGKVWAAGGPYNGYAVSSSTRVEICLPYGCYNLNLYDSYNDGMCCNHGAGGYQLLDANSVVLASGGAFGNIKTHAFCVPSDALAHLNLEVTLQKNVSCAGRQDGAITVAASGGSGNYIYRWNTGANGAGLTGLVAGTYSVTVSDGVQQIVKNATITQPAPLQVQLLPQQHTCSTEHNASITANVQGGTPPYRYLWSNGSTQNALHGLNTGNYQLTVTDHNGCRQTGATNLTAPTPLVLSLTATQAFGTNNGAINLTVSGGTPGYRYRWSNGATTENLQNLGPGTYTVTVTDADNCTASTSQRIEFQSFTNCPSRGSNTQFEWIQQVQLGTLVHNSGNDGGYGNFSHLSSTVQRGSFQSFTLSPGYRTSAFSEYWRVWIDFNRDGDFTDAGEMVLVADGTTGDVSGSLYIPNQVPTGITKMRVSMRYGSANESCGTFPYGEVEDYSILIMDSNAGEEVANRSDIADQFVQAADLVHLYPNPSTGRAVLEYTAVEKARLRLQFYNTLGQLQKTQVIVVQPGLNRMELDLQDLPVGIYLLQGETGKDFFVERLVLQ